MWASGNNWILSPYGRWDMFVLVRKMHLGQTFPFSLPVFMRGLNRWVSRQKLSRCLSNVLLGEFSPIPECECRFARTAKGFQRPHPVKRSVRKSDVLASRDSFFRTCACSSISLSFLQGNISYGENMSADPLLLRI